MLVVLDKFPHSGSILFDFIHILENQAISRLPSEPIHANKGRAPSVLSFDVRKDPMLDVSRLEERVGDVVSSDRQPDFLDIPAVSKEM